MEAPIEPGSSGFFPTIPEMVVGFFACKAARKTSVFLSSCFLFVFLLMNVLGLLIVVYSDLLLHLFVAVSGRLLSRPATFLYPYLFSPPPPRYLFSRHLHSAIPVIDTPKLRRRQCSKFPFNLASHSRTFRIYILQSLFLEILRPSNTNVCAAMREYIGSPQAQKVLM